MYRGVCFSPEKHALFNYISKDDNNTGIEIKRFQSSETMKTQSSTTLAQLKKRK